MVAPSTGPSPSAGAGPSMIADPPLPLIDCEHPIGLSWPSDSILCLEPVGFKDRHNKIIDVPTADMPVLREEPEFAVMSEGQDVQGRTATNAVIIPDRDHVTHPAVSQLARVSGAVA